ncbi:MAG: hypothetical protein EOO62_04850 [Hymenobacter sp.]|nr:MAG: hypothetical protein EOO62_04850 [Hymenobacter sp.]
MPATAAPATLASRVTTCTYFATAGPAPNHGSRLLHLNAQPGALAHNVAFPAEVSAAVAPTGQGLVSVSTHGEHGLSEEELTNRLRTELGAWFGPVANMWRHLQRYSFPLRRLDKLPLSQCCARHGPAGSRDARRLSVGLPATRPTNLVLGKPTLVLYQRH